MFEKYMWIEVVHGSRFITLNVKASDTIGNVKTKIHDKWAIPAGAQHLSHVGAEFEDGKTLSDYNIQNRNVLQMRVDMELYRVLLAGDVKAKIQDAKASDTIDNVTAKIQDKEGIIADLDSRLVSRRDSP